jgi:hypothetical protein
MEDFNFSIIKNKGRVKSSNVKGYRYDTEFETLIIEFNDGSKYLYEFMPYEIFEKIAKGDAECRTKGKNQYGSWYIGKSPSVGAAIWKYIIEGKDRFLYTKIFSKNMIQMKKINPDKLPMYEIVVDDSIETGIRLISIVENPAIEVRGIALSEDKLEKYEFKQVEDKQFIIGPALIPDKKILQENDRFGIHYVFFTKETIEKMVEKFNRSGSNRRINLEHSNQMVDAFIVEDWIIEDPVHDKSRKYGFELPVGTYMVKVKVDDPTFWQEMVRGENKYSFSVEGLMSQSLVALSKVEEKEFTIEDLELEDLFEIFEFAESYDDYPESAKENARIALRWAEENGWGGCGTPVGKSRANQLAKGEKITEETISRMASFARHKQNSDKELGDGCGRLMWLAWGGDEGIEWAQRKLEQIKKNKN